jgi:3-deoxy-manno-octulosonate cytidylyltransferase (CMP-KDO synthetase)
MSRSPVALVLIPARRASTRLPDKMLADLGGAPLVVRTWQAATRLRGARVAVCTDDDAIAEGVTAAGGEVVRTGAHPDGTSRVAEAARILRAGEPVLVGVPVLNLQGDEPFATPAVLAAVLAGLQRAPIATGSVPLAPEEAAAPSRVKVVTGPDGCARWFSRAAIPHGGPYRLHRGVYAFRPAALAHVAQLPPVAEVAGERLEQLHWLAHGLSIAVVPLEGLAGPGEGISVDTAEDLARARAAWPGGALRGGVDPPPPHG